MLDKFLKGKGRKEFEEQHEEEEESEFYYDEKKGIYISNLDGNEYTEKELIAMGYDIEYEEEEEEELEDDTDFDEEEEKQLSELNFEDDSIDVSDQIAEDQSDNSEEDYADEDEEEDNFDEDEEEVEYDDEEEVEYADEDLDGDDYDYYEEEPKSNKLLKAFGMMALIVAVAFALYYFLPKIGEDGKVAGNVNLDTAKEVLTLMYVNSEVNELINKNDKILEYFDEAEHPYLDIRNDDIYMVRYAEFSNNPTTLSIGTLVETEENEVLAKYQINNEVDLPSDRIATFKFNDNGLISNFKEERVYKVIDR